MRGEEKKRSRRDARATRSTRLTHSTAKEEARAKGAVTRGFRTASVTDRNRRVSAADAAARVGASRWISGAIPFGARAGGESTSASGDASARARATATGGAAATAIGERETDLARARRARRAVGRGRGRGRRYGHRCGEGSARGVFFAVAMGGRDASAPRRNGEKRDEKLLCTLFLGKKFQETRAAGR